jgi:hypothetical protein
MHRISHSAAVSKICCVLSAVVIAIVVGSANGTASATTIISAQCKSEQTKIFQYSVASTEATRYVACLRLGVTPAEIAECTSEATSLNLDAFNNFGKVCVQQAGGVVDKGVTFRVQCVRGLDFTRNDERVCRGPSCTKSEVDWYIDNVIEPFLVQEYANRGQQCNVTMIGTTPTKPVATTPKAPIKATAGTPVKPSLPKAPVKVAAPVKPPLKRPPAPRRAAPVKAVAAPVKPRRPPTPRTAAAAAAAPAKSAPVKHWRFQQRLW